jgi:hypothetical protein
MWGCANANARSLSGNARSLSGAEMYRCANANARSLSVMTLDLRLSLSLFKKVPIHVLRGLLVVNLKSVI